VTKFNCNLFLQTFKAGYTQSAVRAVFPAASTLHAIWRKGHAHSRQPTCGNAAHEALQREKVTFDAAADE